MFDGMKKPGVNQAIHEIFFCNKNYLFTLAFPSQTAQTISSSAGCA